MKLLWPSGRKCLTMQNNMNIWRDKNVVICGGASFIGSNLTERLLVMGAKVSVADNFSTGKMEYLKKIADWINIFQFDLTEPKPTLDVFRGKDVVFHLAAVHGGREFISKYPADCCQSLQINENVLRQCVNARVKKIIFSSSVCVYPLAIQDGNFPPTTEEWAEQNKPDDMYGWTKLTMEKALQSYLTQYNLRSSIVRYTTVFGPRENDTHAIIALIKRALAHEDPFLVWGDGKQGRDWIYVDDAVTGTILAAEKIDDATPINLVGTGMITIEELINKIFKCIGWHPKVIKYDITKPVGPEKRLISGERAKKLLDFKPKVSFDEGLGRTIEWLKQSS